MSAARFPPLMLITDAGRWGAELTVERFERAARQARPGSLCLQLRDHGLPGGPRLALARRLAALCGEHGQWLAVNDRCDVALEVGAQVLHLGEQSVPTGAARELFRRRGREIYISRACHEVTSIGAVEADAVVVSPALAPRKGRPALGLQGLREAAAGLRAPPHRPALVALGGVHAQTAAAVLATGCDAVAVQGAAYAQDIGTLLVALGCQR